MTTEFAVELAPNALDLNVSVRPSVRRSSMAAVVRVSAKQAAEAIALIGYPMSRYLALRNEIAAPVTTLGKTFKRARSVYFQNRDEFNRLQPILAGQLEAAGMEALTKMAKLAENFVPMWVTQVKAVAALKTLKALAA